MHQYNGIILCDKPLGLTSHDIINRLRRISEQKKIGHTGTLDPLATGLMVICLGSATKIAQFISDVDKVYEAEIRLGQRSATFDGEGISEDTPTETIPVLTNDQLKTMLKEFEGHSSQKTPAYSAKKINGRRLYKMARKGTDIDTPEQEININSIRLLSYESPLLKIEVNCSKGTYIRSLANDVGEKIGCGAYLSGLVRTAVGRFDLSEAKSLEFLKSAGEVGQLSEFIIPIEEALPFPSVKVNDRFSPLIIMGRSPRFSDIVDIEGKFKPQEYISLRNSEGRIMAIGKAKVGSSELTDVAGQSFFTYIRVLN